jgi:MoxR-like ATPase
MLYEKTFDPKVSKFVSEKDLAQTNVPLGDKRDGSVYVYSDEIILAVNVASAIGRPLLLRGPSGSGKSSLACNIARHLGWRYYEDVISSRTQARDLLWGFDAVRRLNDAQANQLGPGASYIRPGVLWWAFDRESALKRGLSAEDANRFPILEPNPKSTHERAIVMLDEIDKADPDVPNDLLVPLGSLQFVVREAGLEIAVAAKAPPLVLITTNDERELPAAFLRRCVILALEAPKKSLLLDIARTHFGDKHMRIAEELAERIVRFRKSAQDSDAMPSTAEFLDALQVCIELRIHGDSNESIWKDVLKVTISKPRDIQRGIS